MCPTIIVFEWRIPEAISELKVDDAPDKGSVGLKVSKDYSTIIILQE